MLSKKRHLLVLTALVAVALVIGFGAFQSEAADRSVGIRDASDPSAVEGTEVFRFVDTTSRLPLTGWQGVADAIEEFHITVRPEVVAANPERLVVELPFGRQLEAERTKFVDYGPEWKSWFGTLRPVGLTDKGDGFIYLGYHGDQLTAILHANGERYQITGGAGDAPHRLVRQSDELGRASCGLSHLHEDVAERGIRPFDRPDTQTTEGDAPTAEALSGTTYVDVLAVYPKAYFSFPLSEVGLLNFVEDSIALANDVFDNNGMSFEYRLMDTTPILGTNPSYGGGLGTALTWLNGEPSEVQTLRTAYGADVVAIFIPSSWDNGDPLDACGLANFASNDGTNDLIYEGFDLPALTEDMLVEERAFSSNKQSCGLNDYTLAHEIGHNYGMWHFATHPSYDLLEDYGRGYIFDDTSMNPMATVMGCNCEEINPGDCDAGVSAVCNRIAYFSDPGETYDTVTIGTSSDHDNARLGNDRIGDYASFYSATTNNAPSASFSVSCSSRTCTFNAGASSDSDGSIDEYYWWFGDGSTTTTTSSTVVHTYGGTGTSYWPHLVVTDDDDQRDLTLDLLNL